jgi:hypothetical protein
VIKKYKTLKKMKQKYEKSVDNYFNGTSSILSATEDAMKLNTINKLVDEFNSKRFFWQSPLKKIGIYIY